MEGNISEGQTMEGQVMEGETSEGDTTDIPDKYIYIVQLINYLYLHCIVLKLYSNSIKEEKINKQKRNRFVVFIVQALLRKYIVDLKKNQTVHTCEIDVRRL